jgi:RimJ/RimL family protein N-acetyltransferase
MDAIPDALELTDGVVTLRPPTLADVDWVYETLRDADDISRWTRVPHPYEREHALQWIDQSAGGRAAGTDASFLLRDANEGTLLGAVGVHRIGAALEPWSSFLPSELGYWLARVARGRGAATRGVRLVTDWALATRGCPWVTLQLLDGNDASRGVAERAGFTYVGSFQPVPDDADPCARGIPLHRYVTRAGGAPAC